LGQWWPEDGDKTKWRVTISGFGHLWGWWKDSGTRQRWWLYDIMIAPDAMNSSL
jgi:hypothetical protein